MILIGIEEGRNAVEAIPGKDRMTDATGEGADRQGGVGRRGEGVAPREGVEGNQILQDQDADQEKEIVIEEIATGIAGDPDGTKNM